MKIKIEHYNHIKQAIQQAVTQEWVRMRRNQIVIEKSYNDLNARIAYDCAYKANLNTFICNTLYDYLNDTHIKTALKRVCKELNLIEGI